MSRLRITLLFLATATALQACASMTEGMGYEKRAENPSRKSLSVSTDYATALSNTRVIELGIDTNYIGAIQETDARLDIGSGPAYYKIFSIPAAGDFRVKIRSICSCWGFKKNIMPPHVILLGESGEAVGKPLKIKPRTSSMENEHVYAEFFSADLPHGAIYVLVSADASAINSGGGLNRSATSTATGVATMIPIFVGFAETGELRILTEKLR